MDVHGSLWMFFVYNILDNIFWYHEVSETIHHLGTLMLFLAHYFTLLLSDNSTWLLNMAIYSYLIHFPILSLPIISFPMSFPMGFPMSFPIYSMADLSTGRTKDYHVGHVGSPILWFHDYQYLPAAGFGPQGFHQNSPMCLIQSARFEQ